MHPFMKLFETRRVILDGAMGATLQGMGLPNGMKPMEWNLERPDTVKAVHRGYLDAGADVVYSNTFGFDPEEQENWKRCSLLACASPKRRSRRPDTGLPRWI